ncbi:MAG: alkaline phosphatase D family protein [Planctomycetota bacterium]
MLPKSLLFVLLSGFAFLQGCINPVCTYYDPAGRHSSRVVDTIAFGSCFDPRRGGAESWPNVASVEPDVFIMLGDNMYGDTDDMNVMRQKWDELDAIPPFKTLKDNTVFLATWDDHDYGRNDAGAEYEWREESQQVFLDWAGEPTGTYRRTSGGVFDVENVSGPNGEIVQFIILDTRFFRSELTLGENESPRSSGIGGRYVPTTDPDATLLGKEQWQWLEWQLRQPADLRIISSSIQVLAEDHRYEKWANMPAERKRLFDLMKRTNAEGVIFISGDRHRAEISKFDPDRAMPGSGNFDRYPIFDVTSSALNRSSQGRFFEDRFGNEINRHALGQQYQANNFGTIIIDWDARQVTMGIHGDDGEPRMTATVGIDELK